MMRKTILTTMLVLLATAAAWADGELPKLKYFSYIRGGGMVPEHARHYDLSRDKTGKGTLRMKGDCWREELEIAVGEEVFQKVAKLVFEHGLQKSAGFYKPEMLVHDAPSVSFGGAFEGYTSFSGSGDIPSSMSKGLSEICDYLESLRGNNKARGHLDELRTKPDLAGMLLFNGVDLVKAEDMETELCSIAARQIAGEQGEGLGLKPSDLHIQARSDGKRTYLVVENYTHDYADTYFVVQPGKGRHLVDREELVRYMAGTYRGSDGKTYIFTYDGKYKPSPTAMPVSLAFRETDDNICPNVKIGQTWYNFHVTDRGLRLCPSRRVAAMEYECVGNPIELTIDEEEGEKGRWKFTSDAVIERGMLSYLPRRVLLKMADELSARRGYKASDDNLVELEGRSWYKEAQSQSTERKFLSDTEQINLQMIKSAYKFRTADESDADFPLYEE